MSIDPMKAVLEAQKMAEEMQKKIQEQMKNGIFDPSQFAGDYMNAMAGMIPDAAKQAMPSFDPNALLSGDSEEDFDGEEDVDYDNPDNLKSLFDHIKKSMKTVSELPSAKAVSVTNNDPKWLQMGILLSGILANLNGHKLDSLYIEEPNDADYIEEVKGALEDSWGIQSREELLDMLAYLSDEGHHARYMTYCKAKNDKALFNEDMDEDDMASVSRGFLFAQTFKASKTEKELLGWDFGRLALLVRFGFYIGWLSEKEATSMLVSAAKTLSGVYKNWQEFGNSYQFGAAFWKVLGDPCSTKENNANISEAITELLTKDMFGTVGEWSTFPWLVTK